MTIQDFEILAKERFAYCLNLMCGEKHKEYSRNGDKLHNFKKAAEMLDCTPSRALLGMLSKHLVSIIDIVDDIEEGRKPDKKILTEKCSDAINYIVLFEALAEEPYGRIHFP